MGQEFCYLFCWIGVGAGRELISIVYPSNTEGPRG
jgi:hypothetical protein